MERQRTNPDTVICPSCLAENHVFESFCRTCGTPIGSMTNFDPFHIIRSQGKMLQRALVGRPKFIVLLGIWILHLPVFVMSIVMGADILMNIKERADLVFIAIFAGLSYFAFIVLYRITRNYFTRADPGRGPRTDDPRLVLTDH